MNDPPSNTPYFRRNPGLLAAAVVPAAVLLLVAAVQMVRANRTNQSPWKGGGFGMFSSIDSPGERFVRIKLIDSQNPSRHETVEIEEITGRPAHRLRYLPTQEGLARYANFLSRDLNLQEHEWADSVFVGLYRRRWNSTDGTVTAERLLQHQVDLP